MGADFLFFLFTCYVCILGRNWIWDERDGCFEEVKAGRCCLGISYMLFKERESGEMRMGMRMRIRMKMKVGYAEDVVEELAWRWD